MEIMGSLISAANERVNSLLSYIYCFTCGSLAWLLVAGAARGQSAVTETARDLLLFLGVEMVEWLDTVQGWIILRSDLVMTVGWLLLLGGIVASIVDDRYLVTRSGSTILLGAVLLWESTMGDTALWNALWPTILLTIFAVAVLGFLEKRFRLFEGSAGRLLARATRPLLAVSVGLLTPLSPVFWLFGNTENRSQPGARSFDPIYVKVEETRRAIPSLPSGSR